MTHEVLPAIRKTGSYSVAAAVPQIEADPVIRAAQRGEAQLRALQAAKGIIHAAHLEAHARIVAARATGDQPELDPVTRPLYAQTFLKEQGLPAAQVAALGSVFGKRLKKAWVALHDTAPERYEQTVNGQVRTVNAYTESDRDLMATVWAALAAEKGIDSGAVLHAIH